MLVTNHLHSVSTVDEEMSETSPREHSHADVSAELCKVRREVNLVKKVRKNIPSRERDISDTCKLIGVFGVLQVGLV